jgi:hypothetical protein
MEGISEGILNEVKEYLSSKRPECYGAKIRFNGVVYSPKDLLDEVERETPIGKEFVQLWEDDHL